MLPAVPLISSTLSLLKDCPLAVPDLARSPVTAFAVCRALVCELLQVHILGQRIFEEGCGSDSPWYKEGVRLGRAGCMYVCMSLR